MTGPSAPQNRRQLSPGQDRVLVALCLYTHRHRRQPSYSELAKFAGVGAGTIQRYLLDLEAKGWIGGAAGRPRAIEIPDDVFDSVIETGEVPAAPAKT
jgi:hypothetical protein